MSQVKFILADTDPSLQAAISDFIKEEFNEKVEVKIHNNSTDAKKDIGAVIDFISTAVSSGVVVLGFMTTLNSAMGLVDRIERLKRVKQLKNSIESSNKPIYLQIGEDDPIDISNKSTDEIMDLLASIDDKQ